MSSSKKTYFLLFLILVIAIFFRFYKLAEIPPGLYPDVAINGNDAINALKNGDFQVFYSENNGREGLFINLIALSFYFFGVSIWATKAVPAIIGVLTVLGLYLMIKNLFAYIVCHSRARLPARQESGNDIGYRNDWKYEEIIALLSAFFLSVSFWHINFSRLGFRAIMVPFILVWTFYFLFKGIKSAKISFFNKEESVISKLLAICYLLLAGLIFGLGFHTYISFRVAPLIIGAVFLIEIYNFWQLKRVARYSSGEAKQTNKPASLNNSQKTRTIISYWLLFFIAIIITAIPMILYFYHNPSDFMGRTEQVSVLSSAQPIKELSISIVKSLGMFNFWGDCNWRHNYACKPTLPSPIGLLFLFGFFRCLGEIIRSIYKYRETGKKIEGKENVWSFAQVSIFLMIWFFAMLLPEILTNEGLPHSLRAIGAIPPVYIFAGIGGWWIYEEIKKRKGTSSPQTTTKTKTAGKIILIVFLIWLPLYSFNLYFVQWGKNPEVKGAFTQNLVDIGNYLNSLPKNTEKYVIVNENGVPVPYPNGIPMPAQTIIFIEQTTNQGGNTFYFKPEEITEFSKLSNTNENRIIIVLMKYDDKILNELKQKNPQGEIKNINGIWTFVIN